MTEIFLPKFIVRFLAFFLSEKRKGYRALKAYHMALAVTEWARYEEAIRYCDIALIYFKKYTNAYYTKGYCLGYLKRYDEAKINLEQYLSMEENLYDAYHLLGNFELDQENYEASIDYYDKYLDYYKGNTGILNNKGYALLKLEKYKEAIPFLEEATRLLPKFAYAWNNLGFSKFKTGFVEEGLESINHSIELDSSNSYAYKNKAIIYLHQGKKAEAIELLHKAKDLGYQTVYDDEVEILLQRLTSSNDDIFTHFIDD